MTPTESEDILSLILACEPELEVETDDLGIGPYDFGSTRGIDSRPTAGGEVRLSLPPSITREQVKEILNEKENYNAILDRLHERSWGKSIRWSSVLVQRMTQTGILLETQFSCSPPDPEPPDRELERIDRWL
jgi:hypothetical protein